MISAFPMMKPSRYRSLLCLIHASCLLNRYAGVYAALTSTVTCQHASSNPYQRNLPYHGSDESWSDRATRSTSLTGPKKGGRTIDAIAAGAVHIVAGAETVQVAEAQLDGTSVLGMVARSLAAHLDKLTVVNLVQYAHDEGNQEDDPPIRATELESSPDGEGEDRVDDGRGDEEGSQEDARHGSVCA
ncbi:hypothetical protein KCU91_g145, partial [Aureobasidium melanogenum]